jgi:hypothetical protein
MLAGSERFYKVVLFCVVITAFVLAFSRRFCRNLAIGVGLPRTVGGPAAMLYEIVEHRRHFRCSDTLGILDGRRFVKSKMKNRDLSPT